MFDNSGLLMVMLENSVSTTAEKVGCYLLLGFKVVVVVV